MKSEFGRTMLETLALLAVMGILAVSGMELYAKAMSTIRVNHLMEKVYVLALQVRNQNIETHRGRRSVDLPVESNSLSYGFRVENSGMEGRNIVLRISGNVSSKVCSILSKKLSEGYDEGTGEEFGKNGLEGIACDADDGRIVFTFNPKLLVAKKKKSTTYTVEQYSRASSLASQREHYLSRISKAPTDAKRRSIESEAARAGVDLNCTMQGALTCDPLVCDEDHGWFELEEAPGHCEQCPAGYSCG